MTGELQRDSIILCCKACEEQQQWEKSTGEGPVIVRSAVGYFVELFLIVSTDIGVLLLRNPGDILLLWVLAFLALEDRGR